MSPLVVLIRAKRPFPRAASAGAENKASVIPTNKYTPILKDGRKGFLLFILLKHQLNMFIDASYYNMESHDNLSYIYKYIQTAKAHRTGGSQAQKEGRRREESSRFPLCSFCALAVSFGIHGFLG
jgi:hypothetical protein